MTAFQLFDWETRKRNEAAVVVQLSFTDPRALRRITTMPKPRAVGRVRSIESPTLPKILKSFSTMTLSPEHNPASPDLIATLSDETNKIAESDPKKTTF